MQTQSNLTVFVCMIFLSALFSCSKKESVVIPPPSTDSCAGKNIVLTAAPTSATPCSDNGIINVVATGSTNFSYKVNSTGTYQSAAVFNNVVAGTYIVFAKDGSGCEKSVSVTVQSAGTAGALFTDVKNLIAAKCHSCHNASNANGGINFDIDCNIITNKARIKVRAVDQGTMPPTGTLPQSDKDKITNWINAGGTYTK